MADLVLTKITDETKVIASVEGSFLAVKNVGDSKVEIVTESSPLYVSATSNYVVNDINLTYTQSSASNTWVVNHNLNKYCSVTVVDDNNDVVIGEVHYDSVNQITLTLTAAFSGKAYFN